MSAGGSTGSDCREELEHHPDGRGTGQLRDLLSEYGQGWGINPPARTGEPWTTVPRRTGLPIVTGKTLDEFALNLKAAAAAAGLADMLALEAGFPAWRVWRSSEGGWWATRQARVTEEMQDCGLHATAGDVRKPADLRALLIEQAKLEEWAAAHGWQIPGEEARRELDLPPEPSEFRLGRM